MKPALIIITLLLAIARGANAQTYTGKVVSESGKPVKSATVMLLADGGKTTLSFTRTKGDGAFSISVPEGKTAHSMLFSCVGFAKDTIAVSRFRQGQNVVMHEKAIAIKEVKVRAPRIRLEGDTLNYLVSSFRQKQDRSIADVIKKMPGLEVNSDGSIEYQGRRINKFYIEGMDLLGGKYSQASENLSADKVKKVQVLENHQPVKVMRGVSFSQQAALNIVLKDDAKNVWQGMADAGAGSTLQGKPEILGDIRLMEMFFARKTQSISMYKFNNTGKDILKEVADKRIFDDRAPTENGILGNIYLSAPDLEGQRTSFNQSHAIATNWLFKTKGGNDLRLQLSGMLDKSEQQRSTQTVYTDVSGGGMIVEDVSAESRRSEMSAELMYKVNSDKAYVTNTIRGYADFNKSSGMSNLNGRRVAEEVKPRMRYLSDNFEITRKLKNNRTFSLKSYFSYNSLPGTLLLTDNSLQHLDITSMYWGASTYFMHKLGGMYVSYHAKTDGKTQLMETENSLGTSRDRYTEVNTRLTPMMGYNTSLVKLNLQLPLTCLYRYYNGGNKTDFIVEPNLSANFSFTATLSMNLSYQYSWRPYDLYTISGAQVFSDYNSLRQGTGYIDDTKMHVVNSYLSYKNVIKGLFASLSATYMNMRDNILYSSEITDGIYRSHATDRRSNSDMISLHTRLAKSLRAANLNIGVSASYTENNYKLLIGSDIMPYKLRSGYVSADITMQPAKWLSLQEKSYYNFSKQINKNDASMNTAMLNTFTHILSVYFMPGSWQIEWRNEVYHSNDKSVSFNFFSDISVSYRKKTYEAGLYLNNIFGNDRYEQHQITSTQHIYTVNRLRPREITAKVSFSF